MIKRLIYQLGVKWRNPSLMGHFTFLKKSDNWSLEQLKQYQFDRCKELLHFAYEHSPFYKQYFDFHGFDPKAFTSIDDLKKLPVLRKPTLIANGNDIQSTYPFKKLFASKTSGTSGTTLNFRKDESWDSFNRAGLYRGWYWYGIQPWTKKGYLSGFNLAKTALWKLKFQDFLQNRSRNYSFADDDIVRFLNKIKHVEYLHGYASMIYEVAKKAEALGLAGQFNFKAIFG
ncbi:MAG: phenylacetate--CoA ligase family protein, partial [Maribacter arcticus]